MNKKERCNRKLLNGILDISTGSAKVLCDCIGLTYFSNHLLWGGTCNQGQWNICKPDPQRFYSNNWGADLSPDKARTAMEQRGSFASCPAQVPDTITHTTIIIKGIMDSTL